MAVDLPSARLDITPERAFSRSFPIRSGGDTDDRVFGQRGICEQVNYAYASLGRCLVGLTAWATPRLLYPEADWLFSTDSAVPVAATQYIDVVVGDDFDQLVLIADVKNANVRIQIEGGAASTAGGTLGRGVGTSTLTLSSAGAMAIRVEIVRASTPDAYLYGFQIHEVTMVAGDFP